MFDKERILAYIKIHKGKTIGIFAGIIFGIMVLTIGFWRSLFLLICVFVGSRIGNIYDKKGNFQSFLDKILPKGFK